MQCKNCGTELGRRSICPNRACMHRHPDRWDHFGTNQDEAATAIQRMYRGHRVKQRVRRGDYGKRLPFTDQDREYVLPTKTITFKNYNCEIETLAEGVVRFKVKSLLPDFADYVKEHLPYRGCDFEFVYDQPAGLISLKTADSYMPAIYDYNPADFILDVIKNNFGSSVDLQRDLKEVYQNDVKNLIWNKLLEKETLFFSKANNWEITLSSEQVATLLRHSEKSVSCSLNMFSKKLGISLELQLNTLLTFLDVSIIENEEYPNFDLLVKLNS